MQPNQAPPLRRPTRLCATAASARQLCQYRTERCLGRQADGHGCVARLQAGRDASASTTTAKTPLHPAQRRSQKSFNAQLLLEEMSTPYAYLEINLVLGFGYGMGRKPLPVFGCNVLSYYLSVSVLPYSCRTSVKRRLANPRTPIAYCLASSRSDTLCRTALEIAWVKPIARLRQPSVSLL